MDTTDNTTGSVNVIAKEEIHPELPALGACGDLVINSDSDESSEIPGKPGEGDPEKIQQCLSVNQELQKKFVAVLNKIQDSLEKNCAKQAEMRDADREGMFDPKKRTNMKSMKVFLYPYFQDSRGLCPPDNEDTIAKTKNRDITAYVQPPRPWSDEEKTKLQNGVLASALDFVLKKYKFKRDFLRSKLSSPELSDEEKKQLRKSIKDLEKQISDESKRSPQEILEEAGENIDWMKVSATDLEGCKSDFECEVMWSNYLSIFINKKVFTKEEDKTLKSLGCRAGYRNDWDRIARELGTNRSPIQCLERFQTCLNEELVKKFWTPKEDQRLLEVIESVRIGDCIPWNKVSLYMEGRTRNQIINRYERCLNRAMDRGPWSKYEDALLLACISKFKKKWIKIYGFFPHRSTYHLRERFVNYLDANLRIGGWTREEDLKLATVINQHGLKWSKIADLMPGRTDNMCLSRYKRISQVIESQQRHSAQARKEPNYLLKYFPEEPVPTHECLFQNEKMKQAQDIALETLKEALDNIAAQNPANIPSESGAFSTQLLYRLQKELEEMEKREKSSGGGKASSRKRLKFPRDDSASEDEEEDDPLWEGPSQGPSKGGPFSDFEFLWVHEVLELKLHEECATYDLIPVKDKRLSRKWIFGRQKIEQSLYEEYLRKELCLPPSNLSWMEKKGALWLSRCRIDANISVHDVVRHFVQPHVPPTQPPVFAPNRGALCCLDQVLASKARLTRTARFVEHSEPYIRYATRYSEQPPKCLRCSEPPEEDPQKAYSGMVHEMKMKLLVVEESLDEAASVETRSWPELEEECACDQLAKSRDQVDLLFRRFTALFFWPLLLHNTSMTPDQTKEALDFSIQMIQGTRYTLSCMERKKKGMEPETDSDSDNEMEKDDEDSGDSSNKRKKDDEDSGDSSNKRKKDDEDSGDSGNERKDDEDESLCDSGESDHYAPARKRLRHISEVDEPRPGVRRSTRLRSARRKSFAKFDESDDSLDD